MGISLLTEAPHNLNPDEVAQLDSEALQVLIADLATQCHLDLSNWQSLQEFYYPIIDALPSQTDRQTLKGQITKAVNTIKATGCTPLDFMTKSELEMKKIRNLDETGIKLVTKMLKTYWQTKNEHR